MVGLFLKGRRPSPFTLLIIPHSSGQPGAFRVSPGVILAAGAACLVVFLAVAALVLHLCTVGDHYRDQAARAEAELQRDREIGAAPREVVQDINRRLGELGEGFRGLEDREREIRRLMGLEIGQPAENQDPGGGGGLPHRDGDSNPGRGGPASYGQAAGPAVSRGAARREIPGTVREFRAELDRLTARLNTYRETLDLIRLKIEADPEYYRSLPNGLPAAGILTSHFAMRISPFDRRKKEMHYGIDLAAPYGDPVRAAGDGAVVFSGQDPGYGRMIVIDHGRGFETHYGHNSKLLAGEGEKVKKGQVIALIGSSGHSTGSHLHYAVKYMGSFVDPLIAINFKAAAGLSAPGPGGGMDSVP